MISILDRSHDKVIGLRIKGRITEEELDEATREMEDRIEEHGKIRILFHLQDLGGIEPGALLEDFRFAVKHLRDFERYTAVGDQAWLGPWVRTVGLLIPGKGRHFRSGDLEEAWGWLEDGL